MNRVGFSAFLLAVAIAIVVTCAPLALHTMILRGQFRPSLDFLDGARIIVDSLERSEDIRTIRMKNVSIDFRLDRPEIEQMAAALNQPIEDFHVDDAGRMRRMEPAEMNPVDEQLISDCS